jgi:proteasome lid subunit RPN8/RPN11
VTIGLDAPHLLDAVIRHARATFPAECCGMVLRGDDEQLVYHPCENISGAPMQDFCLAADEYAKHEDRLAAIVHSHVGQPPDPSPHDLASCRATDVPWLIVSLPHETHRIVYPSEATPRDPLLGRVYVEGVQDCLTFVLDALEELHGITFPADAFPRFAHRDVRQMVRLARAQGFDVLVADQHDAQPGDVLLMWIGGEGHCGLMAGDGRFLHHNRGGLSHEAVWGGWYRKHTVYLLRSAK